MSGGMNLEVWFPQQNEVSVFLESSVGDPEEEQSLETGLFALYAARQIANLGGDGYSLAAVLQATDTAEPLSQAEQRLGDVRVTSPRASGGRKGFTVELRPDERAFFKLKAHGFGMMGKGVGYYAPTSTLALLYWLLNRRKDDRTYQRALAAAAENVGIAGSQGLINVTSQADIAMQAAGAAWGEAIEAQQAAEIEAPEGLDVESLPFDWGGLVASTHARLREMSDDVPAGEVLIFPEEVSIPFCQMNVLHAAGLGDDERVTRAYGAVASAVDDATREAANAYLNNVVAEILDENKLLPAADALFRTLFTDDVERAVQG